MLSKWQSFNLWVNYLFRDTSSFPLTMCLIKTVRTATSRPIRERAASQPDFDWLSLSFSLNLLCFIKRDKRRASEVEHFSCNYVCAWIKNDNCNGCLHLLLWSVSACEYESTHNWGLEKVCFLFSFSLGDDRFRFGSRKKEAEKAWLRSNPVCAPQTPVTGSLSWATPHQVFPWGTQ